MLPKLSTNGATEVVLIGFAEALAAPEVLWSLVEAGFHVVAFARRGRKASIRHSRFVEIREITPPEVSIDRATLELGALLSELAQKEQYTARVLFPLDDTAVHLCEQVHVHHSDTWHLAGPCGAGAALALDKRVQVERAQRAGFRVPLTSLVQSAGDAARLAKTISFPMILKAAECVPVRDGAVRKGRMWICANRVELDRALLEWGESGPLLAQQHVAGNGEGAFGIRTAEGVCAWSGHRRLRMMNPHGSGSSACVSQTVDECVQQQTERMLASVGWQGVFMVELLRDAAGELWFVELNGRPWGSTALSRRQGLEYPAWQVQARLGRDWVEPASPVTAGVVCRNIGREIMHLLFVIRGPKSSAVSEWPPIWKTAADVFGIGNRQHLYNWHPQDAKVFAADCYYTLRDNLWKGKG